MTEIGLGPSLYEMMALNSDNFEPYDLITLSPHHLITIARLHFVPCPDLHKALDVHGLGPVGIRARAFAPVCIKR